LAAVLPIIHEILEADQKAPRKQRHTAKRIFERLKAEYGYPGGKTVVEDAVRAWRQTHQEVLLPPTGASAKAFCVFLGFCSPPGYGTSRWSRRRPAWQRVSFAPPGG
jgi:hypothetical protein